MGDDGTTSGFCRGWDSGEWEWKRKYFVSMCVRIRNQVERSIKLSKNVEVEVPNGGKSTLRVCYWQQNKVVSLKVGSLQMERKLFCSFTLI